MIAAFKHPLAEAMLVFLHAAFLLLINLNLFLQRPDLLIHILYNALFTCVKQLLSRFTSPELVRKFANGNVTIVQIKGEVLKDVNILDTIKMFISFLLCLDKDDISERFWHLLQIRLCVSLHNFYLQYQQLSVTWWIFAAHLIHKFSWSKIHLPKCSCHCWEVEVIYQFLWSKFVSAGGGISVPSVYHLRWYVGRSVAIYHGNEKHAVICWINVLWYHLLLQKVPGTSWSKFHHLFKRHVSGVMHIHSNTEEEFVFSPVKKNLTPHGASLELGWTKSIILPWENSPSLLKRGNRWLLGIVFITFVGWICFWESHF